MEKNTKSTKRTSFESKKEGNYQYGKTDRQGSFGKPNREGGKRDNTSYTNRDNTKREDRPRKDTRERPSGGYSVRRGAEYPPKDTTAAPRPVAVAEEVLPEGDIIAGRNAVIEALRSDRCVDTVYLAEMESSNPGASGAVGKIRAIARESGAVVKDATREKLNQLAGSVHHQGVVAICSCAEYVDVDDLLAESKRKGTVPFLLIADEIEDPHNLGAIIRTAEACGADGLILPKRRSASLNATVYKTSAGAASVLKVARVANLVSCIKELKKQNIWIFGADMEGSSWDKLDFTVPCALVIGSEGKGISRLLREECDFLSTLPMLGQINSLNASVAAGIMMYEVVRQRQR